MEFVRNHKLVPSFRNIGPIDEDLLIEVLCRLPAKILMRCCCVCKPWYILVHRYCVPRITPSLPLLGFDVRVKASSSKNFVIVRAVIPEVGADVDAWPPVFNIHDPTVGGFSPSSEHLLDSRDGLMLFRHPSENKYVLCNPNTKQFLFIPCPDKPGSCAVLAVDIQNWKPDGEMDFFKIISFPENKGILDVFSSRNSTWVERKVKCCPHRLASFVDDGTFSLDKTYLYLDRKLYTLCHPEIILWFTIGDVNVDVVFNFILAPVRGRAGRGGCIGSWEGHMQFVHKDEALDTLNIWQHNPDAGVWTGIYRVKLRLLYQHPDLRTMFPAPKPKILALDPLSNDGLIIWASNRIFCFYFKSGNLVQLQRLNVLNDAIKHTPKAAFAFTRCLASLTLAR